MKAATLEQNSLKVAVYGNIFMALLGLTFAWYTDSQAVLLDGVFSLIAPDYCCTYAVCIAADSAA